MDTAREFWSHVRRIGTCWVWDLSIRADTGYGQVNWCGRIRYAHHVAWELKHGTIPKGKQVLHKCDTKNCMRPRHLYLGTRLDNARDFMTRQWHKHNTRKLTPNDVRRIRMLFHTMTYAEIARLYHVEYKAVRRIATGEYWRHVK